MYATDSAGSDNAPAKEFTKRTLLVALFAAIVAVALPNLILRELWIEGGRSKNVLVTAVFLSGVQLYMMVLYPVIFTHMRPQLGRFEPRWFRWTRDEIIRLPLLFLGILLVYVLVIAIAALRPEEPRAFLESCDTHGAVFGVWLALGAIILGPIAEEVFWRGYVQSTMTILIGDEVATLAQAVLFGLLHLSGTLDVVHAGLMGFIFGIWCSRRRTLIPVIAVHVIQNAMAVRLGIWH